jgi:hypothetical protein
VNVHGELLQVSREFLVVLLQKVSILVVTDTTDIAFLVPDQSDIYVSGTASGRHMLEELSVIFSEVELMTGPSSA